MTQNSIVSNLPLQYQGQRIVASHKRIMHDEFEAGILFKRARQRITEINRWHELGGTATFYLTDSTGAEVNRQPLEGDFIKVDIPGPGPGAGNGYDWVRIESIEEGQDNNHTWFSMRVRPSAAAGKNSQDIAHFYDSEATGNFIITCKDTQVEAIIVDSNVLPNKDAGNVKDQLRDIAVALAGIAGISRLQWKGLVEGFLS